MTAGKHGGICLCVSPFIALEDLLDAQQVSLVQHLTQETSELDELENAAA